MYKSLLSEGCTPNLVTFNTLIEVYSKTNAWQDAVSVLDALEAQARPPGPGCTLGVPSHRVCGRWGGVRSGRGPALKEAMTLLLQRHVGAVDVLCAPVALS